MTRADRAALFGCIVVIPATLIALALYTAPPKPAHEVHTVEVDGGVCYVTATGADLQCDLSCDEVTP